jgi:hypothetical protein
MDTNRDKEGGVPMGEDHPLNAIVVFVHNSKVMAMVSLP